MLDINKLKELKSALDEGFALEKEDVCLSRDYDFEKDYFLYCFTTYRFDDTIDILITEQNFDKFCEKVANAILEVQE